MFNWIYKQIEDEILDLVDERVKKIKSLVGEPKRTLTISLFDICGYNSDATGLYKEIERIHEYLNVELVKTEATEKLVDKKKKK